MTMQCLKYPQVQGLCIPSGGLFVNLKKRSNSRGSGRRKRGSYRPCEAREGGGSVKADQFSRGKLRRVIYNVSSCFDQAEEDIALYRLIGDDVHPYRINDCDDRISSRARQLNRDITEVPKVVNEVNVASSMVTAPLIESRPCSGNRGA